MNERKYYIDNIRWMAILLLIPFHAAMAWNNWEGNYIWFSQNRLLSFGVMFLCPYFMPLLFAIAGISASYSLSRRGYKHFAIERVKKLLIPLISGTLTVVASMTYFSDKFHNNYNGSFIGHYKIFLTKCTDMTGYDGTFTPGHLWFLLYLIIISFIAMLIIFEQKKYFPKLLFKSCPAYIIPMLILFPILMNDVLNFGGKSIGLQLVMFLIGYYVLSEENVLQILSRYCYIYLAIVMVCDGIMSYLFVVKGQRDSIFLGALNMISLWFGVIGIIGFARSIFNINNKFTKYMTARSFLIYIFHFGWLVFFQYLLSLYKVNTYLCFLLSITGTLIMTLLTCEIVIRVPVLGRFFGMKTKGNNY